jgi:hypothetical protein
VGKRVEIRFAKWAKKIHGGDLDKGKDNGFGGHNVLSNLPKEQFYPFTEV